MKTFEIVYMLVAFVIILYFAWQVLSKYLKAPDPKHDGVVSVRGHTRAKGAWWWPNPKWQPIILRAIDLLPKTSNKAITEKELQLLIDIYLPLPTIKILDWHPLADKYEQLRNKGYLSMNIIGIGRSYRITDKGVLAIKGTLNA